jgi:DNA replication protein DnaC
MNITSGEYNDIINEYRTRQLENEHLLAKRREEIYANIPRYKEMDEQIVSLSAERTRAMIRKDTDKANRLTEQLEDLQRDLKLLLTGAGYSINYLDPQYSCPYCKDTGFIEGVRCHCFKQAILDRVYEQSNIKEQLADENFDMIRHDFQVGEAARDFEKALSKARNFADVFGKQYANICFTGPVGTGKTFLSNCIVNEVLKKGYSCIYFSAPTLFNTISDYKFHNKSEKSENPLNTLYSCDLLVIDDLGTELSNSFSTSELLTLLNERFLAKKPIVLSTNLSLEDLCARYSDRVFSRLFSNFEICTLSGQDIRLYIKQMQNRK